MNSRVLAAIIAAVLALAGIIAAAAYAASANSRAFDGAALVEVYQVTKDIPADSDSATVAASVELVSLPNKAVAKGAVKDLGKVEGKKTVVAMVQGEQLVESRFSEAGSAAAADTSVPEGLQVVAVKLTRDAAGGELEPGMRVGVIGTVQPKEGTPISRMFSQNVLVTGVDIDEGSGEGIVSLAVNGKQATQVAAAMQGGNVRLTIQNAKTESDGGSPVELESLVK